MVHPGYPNGGATGLLIKDYRGKDANREIWKFDSALEAKIFDALKQAAIEEGQWTEKRDVNAAAVLAEMKARSTGAATAWPPRRPRLWPGARFGGRREQYR